MAMLSRETIRLPNGRNWQVHRGGSGPDLLWLHGIRGVDAADPLLAALTKHFRVTAPTAPGFFDIAEIDDIQDIHEYVLDYDDLLGALGLDRFAILGHSFGAMIGAEIAAHYPKAVSKLVLLAPVGLWNDAYKVADIFAVPMPEVDNLLWNDPASREAHAVRIIAGAEATPQQRTLATVQGLTAMAKFMMPIPDRRLSRRLARIAAPTLLLFGADDKIVPKAYAADFLAGLSDAESVTVPGAGHMLQYERPAEVIPSVEAFLG